MQKSKLFYYLLLIPLIILFIIFKITPFIYSFIYSFLSSNKINSGNFTLLNYSNIFTDKLFINAILNSIVIFTMYIIIKIPLLVIYSTLISNLHKSKKKYLSLLYIPSIIGGFAFALIFKYIFTYDGFANQIIYNLFNLKINWFGKTNTSRAILAFSLIWSSFGISIFIMVNRLGNINKSVVESMELDGVNFIQKIKYLTIPYGKSVLLYTVFIGLIEVVGMIDVPMNLTSGGPGNSTVTIGYYIFKIAFDHNNFPYAATIGVILVLITTIFVIIYRVIGGKINENI